MTLVGLIRVKGRVVFLVVLAVSMVIAQDSDDYGRRNRRRRPQNQSTGSGPCGRFLGLTYLNFNYNVDCGGHGGHGGGGSIDDFLGGGHSSHGGHGGHGAQNGYRPPKPHRPPGGFGSGGSQNANQGDSQSQGGFFNRPIWGVIGGAASSIGSTVGNTVGSFTNGFNDVGGGSGSHFFDGSIINSFASLFSHAGGSGGSDYTGSGVSGGVPPRPQVPNNPAPVTESIPTHTQTTQSISGFPNIEPHPVVPIVDLRPVHEEYYDEVTEASLYGSTNSKFLNNRYVSGGANHHNHNGGLFDINYTKAFKKINRNINQAFHYLFRR